MKKKNKEVTVFRLSNESVEFIKKYLLKDTDISKINADILAEFVAIAFDYESLMVDKNGSEKTYDYPDKERNEMADRFISEISVKLESDLWVIDFDDLNKRLGLD